MKASLGDEAQSVHVVAGVEVEAEETHGEAGGQQDDVGDGEADEVFHDDGWVRTELWWNLSRYISV